MCGIAKDAYWHFGIRSRAILFPTPAFEIRPHVLFSDDGSNIWESKERLHKKRRSHCKNWWNDEWRDRILAVMSWLAEEHKIITLPVAASKSVSVGILPLSFYSPIAYTDPKEVHKGGSEIGYDEQEEDDE